MVLSLCFGCVAALFVGTFLGVLSDLIGHRKVCLIFCILHLFVGIWKKVSAHPSIWVASIYLSLATSIFSISFETWMVVEHEKQGHRQDTLSDMFWLMTEHQVDTRPPKETKPKLEIKPKEESKPLVENKSQVETQVEMKAEVEVMDVE